MVMDRIKEIWIGSEIKSAIIGIDEKDKEENDSSDVIVTFENGEKYVTTFYTYKNIEWLRNKNA
tara:strand:+ start:7820 stop:8011 length:192 start_codon:yes stop_codon:yes gene_type:complete